MAVTIGTPTTANMANGSATTTFSFVSNGSPLYVLLSGWCGGTGNFSGVTFNAVALTKLVDSGFSNGGDFAQIWRLTAPATTTANIVATLSAGSQQAGVIGAMQTSGQDTTTPEGTAVSNKSAAAGTGTGSLSVAGNGTGDLTLYTITNGGGAAITPGATGGGTVVELWDAATNGQEGEGARVPDAATAVSGTFTSNSWAIAAIPLKTAAAPADPFPAGYRLGRQQPPNRQTLLAR